MPSPLVHLTAGYVAYRLLRRPTGEEQTKTDWFLLSACLGSSMLPDVDTVVGLLVGNVRSFHNQGAHSLISGLLVALLVGVCASLWRRREAVRWSVVVAIGYCGHVVLDSLIRSRGVMLFWPITDTRFTSPVPIFYGVKWSEGLVNPIHFVTAGSELLVVALALLLVHFWPKLRPRKQRPESSQGKGKSLSLSE